MKHVNEWYRSVYKYYGYKLPTYDWLNIIDFYQDFIVGTWVFIFHIQAFPPNSDYGYI